MKIEKNISLKEFNTFKVGGIADYFCKVSSVEELKKVLEFAKNKNLPIFVLGDGSNILVSDDGFRGLVIKNKIHGFKKSINSKKVKIIVGAGENWDEIVKKLISLNLAGVECLSGVPGTVGAVPVNNIACYGQSVDKVIRGVNAIEVKTGRETYFSKKKCNFNYRASFFKTKKGRNFIITHVEFVFDKDQKPSAKYKDYKYNLTNYFKNKKKNPTLLDIRNAVIDIRSKKGMILDRKYKSYKSAGSFFKAPVVSQKMFKNIKNIAKKESKIKMRKLKPWYWNLNSKKVKIAPAFLMEYTNFKKGYISGNVGVSSKHSLAIINLGKASASEIFGLSQKIKKEVYKKFKIKLKEEVQLIGKF